MGGILVAGHLCLDLTPALASGAQIVPGQLIEIGELALSLGGCVANTGRTLATLGVPVRLAGAIADDELGNVLRTLLTSEALPAEELTVIPKAATSYSLVLQVAGSDRTFWHHLGVNAFFDGTALDLGGIDLLHVGYPPLLPALVEDGGRALVRLFERAGAAGITTSLDMSVVDQRSSMGLVDWDLFLQTVLPHTDIFTPSFDDLASALRIDEPISAELTGELAQRCVAYGVAVATISGGADGLLLATAKADRFATGGRVLSRLGPEWSERRLRRAAQGVEIVATTNGAGDAATAGLLYAVIERMGPDDALQLAVETAAVAISGGLPEHPAPARSVQS
jgi:sugar/nucleoside kinase (ribokinase family)